ECGRRRALERAPPVRPGPARRGRHGRLWRHDRGVRTAVGLAHLRADRPRRGTRRGRAAGGDGRRGLGSDVVHNRDGGGLMTLGELAPLLLDALGQTAFMVLITLAAGGVVGLALGIGLYVTRSGNLLANRAVFTILNLAVNIVRPLPFIIFLVALGPLTKLVTGRIIGIEAFTFAMCFMAAFVFSRLVEQNLLSIDPGVVEAARAMGASPLRIILTVLIPEALAP